MFWLRNMKNDFPVHTLIWRPDISTVENPLQTDLQIVSAWLIDHKLSLHLGKTGSVLFGSKSTHVCSTVIIRYYSLNECHFYSVCLPNSERGYTKSVINSTQQDSDYFH